MHVRRQTTRPASPGFTLVELMIVIAIIALLIALTIPLIASVLLTTRRGATKATMEKLDALLQRRQDAFNRGYPKEFFRTNGIEFSYANRTHIIARKTRFAQLFLLTNDAAYRNVNSAADSAEVLYRMLTDTETYGTAAEDISQFSANEVGDTDGDGKLEFLDGWGNPIRYYAFPTRAFKPNGHSTSLADGGVDRTYAIYLFNSLLPNAQLNQDKDDPLNILTQSNISEATLHTYSTHHVLLIVSAGEDGSLGLYEPSDRANFGHLAAPDTARIEDLYDNITNHNTRTGDN